LRLEFRAFLWDSAIHSGAFMRFSGTPMADTAITGLSELPPDFVDFRDSIRELVRQRVAPRAAAIDAAAEYPWDIRELFAAHDLLGLPFDTEHGGAGTGTLMLNVAIEEVAKACASSAAILMLQDLGALPIRLFGTDKQKHAWLPRCASGEWAPALAFADPQATGAVRDGDWWVLNGTSGAVHNAGVADLYVVLAVTDREQRRSTAFVVEADRPGFSIPTAERKLGVRGAPTGTRVLADVRVPDEHRLGEVGEGADVARATLRRGRLGAAALAIGIAQGAADHATAFATAHAADSGDALAAMATRIAAARELLYRGYAMADHDDPGLGEHSSKAERRAADVAMEVIVEAVRVLGGYGYAAEDAVERALRDAAQTLAEASA
jgi:acyl-CoA dehydrogenase